VPLVTVPVARVEAATPRSRLVTLDIQGTRFVFTPGQAVIVGSSGERERRPYSIASSPEQTAESGRLELLVGAGVTADAAFTAGRMVDVEGPVGTFTLPPDAVADWILFVAGGTGIAPLRSMLDHLLRRRPHQRISLLYSARSGDEFAFIEELDQHARTRAIELHQTVTRLDSKWSGRRGRIGRAHFEAVVHEPAGTLALVCGPPALVEESVMTLKALGVPEERIRTESWGR
jgi:NAD(P)H-flavin reductase